MTLAEKREAAHAYLRSRGIFVPKVVIGCLAKSQTSFVWQSKIPHGSLTLRGVAAT